MSASKLITRLCRQFSSASGNVFHENLPQQVAAFNSVGDRELKRRVDGWKKPYIPGLLNKQELEAFWEDGFVIKHNVLTKEELDDPIRDINQLVGKLAAELKEAGLIKNLHEDKHFYNRLTYIEKEFPDASVLLHKHGVLTPGMQKLWSNSKLMSAALQVVGPDISGHPVWNLRTKTPGQESSVVPWHQDNGYIHPNAWSTLQLTAWIPFIDANLVNGCMQVARGGHKSGKTARHNCCVGGTWYVELEEAEIEKSLGVNLKKDLVTCEMPMGSVLFLNNLIPHRSLPNTSDKIRWSMDLRWLKPQEPNGVWGLKESILMRDSKNPSKPIDWSKWATIDRQQLAKEDAKAGSFKGSSWHGMPHPTALEPTNVDPRFDTTITGPWLRLWPLVHHNKHTKAMGMEGADRPENWTKA
jgi:hypothetical protein